MPSTLRGYGFEPPAAADAGSTLRDLLYFIRSDFNIIYLILVRLRRVQKGGSTFACRLRHISHSQKKYFFSLLNYFPYSGL